MQNGISKVILGISAVCYLSAAFLASGQDLPEGEGKAQFQRICSACHGVDVVTRMRLGKAEWAGVVEDMVSRGAQGKQDELQSVTSYLAANFGKDRPLGAASSPPANQQAVKAKQAIPTSAGVSQLSTEELLKGKTILNENGCLTCHRIGDQGSRVGPDLSAIGADRTAEQIERSIVAPDEEVLPENRYARVVTKDGATITGKLLNQDGFSVQMMDSNEQLRSFMRADLKEYTILEKGLMPSYEKKLSTEQLAELVKYLSSFKGSSTQ